MPEHRIPVGGVAPTGVQALYQMQDMTRRTGILHEIQTRHLKVWGMAALGVTKIEVRYFHEPPVVEFRTSSAVLYRGQPPDNLTKRLEYLDECVRFLLGAEYRVTAVFDEDVVWDKLGKTECQTKPPTPDSPTTKPAP